jgi:hypothetical protein
MCVFSNLQSYPPPHPLCLWQKEDPALKRRESSCLRDLNSDDDIKLPDDRRLGFVSYPHLLKLNETKERSQVRLYSFMEHREIYKRRFNAACSVLLWLPLSTDPSAQSVVVGFQNGAIRVLEQAKDHWSLIYAMKPHKVRERASPVCCCFPPIYPPVCSIFLFRCY